MKAVSYKINGEPWDVIGIEDVPEPTLSDGQVLVALEAAPIHIADLLAIRANEPFFPIAPGVGGFEGVGRVMACSADVNHWRPGDRVFLPIGYGAWQERHAVDAGHLVRAPEDVAAEQLALVPINLATAYLLLHAYETLSSGDWVIQNAANSNVATYVDVFARRAGINIINLVRRPDLIAPLKAQGRAHVFLDRGNLEDCVRSVADAAPKLAFDAVGGAATARLGGCVADHGLVLSYGFLSKEPHELSYPDLMFRGVRLRGVMTNWAMDRLDDAGLKTMRAEMDALAASGRLNAAIAGVYPFSQAADALLHAARTGPDRQGKVILVPD